MKSVLLLLSFHRQESYRHLQLKQLTQAGTAAESCRCDCRAEQGARSHVQSMECYFPHVLGFPSLKSQTWKFENLESTEEKDILVAKHKEETAESKCLYCVFSYFSLYLLLREIFVNKNIST